MYYHLLTPKLIHWPKDFIIPDKGTDLDYKLLPELAFYDRPERKVEGVKMVHEMEIRWRFSFEKNGKMIFSIVYEQLVVLCYNPIDKVKQRLKAIMSLSHYCVQIEYYLSVMGSNMEGVQFPLPTGTLSEAQLDEIAAHLVEND